MTDQLSTWIAAYRRAWESNEPDDIRALFTEGAEYRTEPWAEPWRGDEEIVREWLANRDEAGTTTFTWAVLSETAEVSIAELAVEYIGLTRYRNIWIVRFAAGGRASSFTEWYMEELD